MILGTNYMRMQDNYYKLYAKKEALYVEGIAYYAKDSN